MLSEYREFEWIRRASERKIANPGICMFAFRCICASLYIAMRGSHRKGPSAPFRKKLPKNWILNRYQTSEFGAVQELICIAARQHENDTCWLCRTVNDFTIFWSPGFSWCLIFGRFIEPCYFWVLCTFDKLVHSIFVRSALKINAIAIDCFAVGMKKKVFVDRSEAKVKLGLRQFFIYLSL